MKNPIEIVIVSPYDKITGEFSNIIRECEPTATVDVISDLNNVINIGHSGVSLGFGKIDFGKNYHSIRGVDFSGSHWDYNKDPDFGTYVERQLHEAGEIFAEEIMESHHPSFVIDFEQLIGNRLDLIGVYNIECFNGWCSKNNVPRLSLPAEMKMALKDRMKSDGYQGYYTETSYLEHDELQRAERDLIKVLAGDYTSFSFFQYRS